MAEASARKPRRGEPLASKRAIDRPPGPQVYCHSTVNSSPGSATHTPSRRPVNGSGSPRPLLLKLAMLCMSTLIALGVAEVVARMLPRTQLDNEFFRDLQTRFLLWTLPPFVREKDGAIRYVTNQQIREVVVYNKTVEFDWIFPTNNLGLIDTVDYETGPIDDTSERYAFAGDSFTVGSGGMPWVPTLREEVQKIRPKVHIYNMGLLGASMGQLHVNLVHFSKILPFSNIVILAISNDFERPPWFPLAADGDVRFCPGREDPLACATWRPVATVISPDATHAEILDHIENTRRRWHRWPPDGPYVLPHTFGRALHFSRLATMVDRGLVQLATRYLKRWNLAELRRLRESFPRQRIQFIHLAEKQEVTARAYRIPLRDAVTARGIEYFPALEHCDWSPAMFHIRDHHPNAAGYRQIAQCVREHLFRQ